MAAIIVHSGASKWRFLLAVLNSIQGQVLSAEAAFGLIATLVGVGSLWHCWRGTCMQPYPPKFLSLAALKVMEAPCGLLLHTTQLFWSLGSFSQGKASRVPAEPSLGTADTKSTF